MMKLLKWAGAALTLLVLALALGYAWASSAAGSKLSQPYTAHAIDIPVPMPLTEAELAELAEERRGEGAAGEAEDAEEDSEPIVGVDLEAVALERALARGKHLVESRFVCIECHGADFAGGVMVDDPAMGRFLGPNLTAGKGSKTAGYTMADWDRIVRHGIRQDGKPAIMPSEDFVAMSDRELSDVVAYIRSMPPVDKEVPASTLGPVAKVLMATGKLPLSADMVHDHQASHAVEPPATADTVEFGKHMAQVCTGCHRHNLEGGPIAAGSPSWAPAANLTTHADGMSGWTFEQFSEVMRTGKRPNGAMVLEPMTLIPPYAEKMTEIEMRALFTYLQSVPPLPLGK